MVAIERIIRYFYETQTLNENEVKSFKMLSTHLKIKSLKAFRFFFLYFFDRLFFAFIYFFLTSRVRSFGIGTNEIYL